MEVVDNIVTIGLRSMKAIDEYYGEDIVYTFAEDVQEKTIFMNGKDSKLIISDLFGTSFSDQAAYMPQVRSPYLFPLYVDM